MMKKMMLLLAVLLLVMPLVTIENAAAAPGDAGDCAQDVRPAVKTVFEEGKAAGKSLNAMVADAINLGPNLCGVLVVAEEQGYSQEDVLQALRAAGVDSSVIARAAMDAGYDNGVVARVLGQQDLAAVGGAAGTAGATVSAPASAGGGGRNAGTVSPAK